MAGIELTEPPREAVLNAFKFGQKNLELVRPIELGNSQLPALQFTPLASRDSAPDQSGYLARAAATSNNARTFVRILSELGMQLIPVEPPNLKRDFGLLTTVENGGAHVCFLVNGEDQSVSSDLHQVDQETQECVAIWNFGRTFVARC